MVRRKASKPDHEARKAGMTQEAIRRECEITFLNQRPKLIPKVLYSRCRKLFRRRAEMLTSHGARFGHDLARVRAVKLLLHVRIKEGLDDWFEEKWWAGRAQDMEDHKAAWLDREEEHTAWVIKKLEKKNSAGAKGFNCHTEGKLAACRDLLHATLQLKDGGGIVPDRVSWLRHNLSHKAYAKRLKSTVTKKAYWLGLQQAMTYIAACRREANINGHFEKTGRHRKHVLSMLVTEEWTRDQLEQRDWATWEWDGIPRLLCQAVTVSLLTALCA